MSGLRPPWRWKPRCRRIGHGTVSIIPVRVESDSRDKPAWPGLSGPPVAARAGIGGPDKPGHDEGRNSRSQHRPGLVLVRSVQQTLLHLRVLLRRANNSRVFLKSTARATESPEPPRRWPVRTSPPSPSLTSPTPSSADISVAGSPRHAKPLRPCRSWHPGSASTAAAPASRRWRPAPGPMPGITPRRQSISLSAACHNTSRAALSKRSSSRGSFSAADSTAL